MVNVTTGLLCSREIDQVLTVHCGPHDPPGLLRKISPPPPGIRSPDRPARSKSLYRLRYPGPPLLQRHRHTGNHLSVNASRLLVFTEKSSAQRRMFQRYAKPRPAQYEAANCTVFDHTSRDVASTHTRNREK